MKKEDKNIDKKQEFFKKKIRKAFNESLKSDKYSVVVIDEMKNIHVSYGYNISEVVGNLEQIKSELVKKMTRQEKK